MGAEAETTATVLVVDDEAEIVDLLTQALRRGGFSAKGAFDAEDAMKTIARGDIDLVVTDVMMPKTNGLQLLANIRALPGEYTPVILITGYASETVDATEALRLGADDFLSKPIKSDELCLRVRARLRAKQVYKEMARLARERDEIASQNQRLCIEMARCNELTGPIRTPALARLFDLADSIRESNASVLLTGETGTGKGAIARYLHDSSLRYERPFVTFHCGSIPATLLSSELFGHERGAFTGADRQRIGRLEAAAGGTLFLDEIGDITAEMQVALLRFLQDGEFERLGSSKTLRSEVRLIAATNRDLPAAVAAGQFRADLFYRLNVVGIEIPPLRKRLEDLPILAQHFLVRAALRAVKQVTSIDPAALDRLLQHSWPGNLRELENVIERALVVARGLRLTADDIHFGCDLLADRSGVPLPSVAVEVRGVFCPMCQSTHRTLYECLAGIECWHLERALERACGNQSEAARLLGIPRTTLLAKMRQHDLPKSAKSFD